MRRALVASRSAATLILWLRLACVLRGRLDFKVGRVAQLVEQPPFKKACVALRISVLTQTLHFYFPCATRSRDIFTACPVRLIWP